MDDDWFGPAGSAFDAEPTNYVEIGSQNDAPTDFYTPEPDNYVERWSANPGSSDSSESFGVMQNNGNAEAPTPTPAPEDTFSRALSAVANWGFQTAKSARDSVKTATTDDKGKMNQFTQLILAGALQGYGQGQVANANNRAASRERAADRRERREDRDETYRRGRYGTTQQMTARMGSGGLVKGGL